MRLALVVLVVLLCAVLYVSASGPKQPIQPQSANRPTQPGDDSQTQRIYGQGERPRTIKIGANRDAADNNPDLGARDQPVQPRRGTHGANQPNQNDQPEQPRQPGH